MNAGVTAERVYDALKARLLSGEVLPGERVEPGIFAEKLGSSVTPVRDALHRMAGEHIVEMRAAEGFQLPFVTEPGLRALLVWNSEILRIALHRGKGPFPTPDIALAKEDPVDAVRQLFAAIAARSADIELIRQVEMASDRLTTARMAESRLRLALADDLEELAKAAADEETKELQQRVAAYHRQRVALVPALVQAMYLPR